MSRVAGIIGPRSNSVLLHEVRALTAAVQSWINGTRRGGHQRITALISRFAPRLLSDDLLAMASRSIPAASVLGNSPAMLRTVAAQVGAPLAADLVCGKQRTGAEAGRKLRRDADALFERLAALPEYGPDSLDEVRGDSAMCDALYELEHALQLMDETTGPPPLLDTILTSLVEGQPDGASQQPRLANPG